LGESFVKKILFLITIIASLFIIKDLLYSIYTLWHKNDLLIVAQKQLLMEEKTNARLKVQLNEAKKPSYVESQARNELFMVKPGENVVLLSQNKAENLHPVQEVSMLANWQQWVNLFFPNTY
jgi:cell division protein FtsB